MNHKHQQTTIDIYYLFISLNINNYEKDENMPHIKENHQCVEKNQRCKVWNAAACGELSDSLSVGRRALGGSSRTAASSDTYKHLGVSIKGVSIGVFNGIYLVI